MAKKPIKKTIISKEEKFDVICCLLQPNPEYFYNNVETWFREIPINKLYFGCNLATKEVEKLQKQYSEIELIDQQEIKTQGKCLADLMSLVKTKWFIYLHCDVELTPYCFEVMKRERNKDVGIIESNRVISDGFKQTYPNYIKEIRSYSGFQLIQKKAIEAFISTIDDDYIFRNEDLIFQNVIERAEYQYVKSWAMHIHQSEVLQLNSNYQTQGEKRINECMFKGIIKYTIPEPKILTPTVLISITNYLRNYGMDIFDFYTNFIMKHNKEWGRIILNKLTGGSINEEKEFKKHHRIQM